MEAALNIEQDAGLTRGDLIVRAEAVKEMLETDGWQVFAEAITAQSRQIHMGLLNGGPYDQVGKYERQIGEMRGLGLEVDVAQAIIDMGEAAGAEAHLEEG